MKARHELAKVAHSLLTELIPAEACLSLPALVERLERRIAQIRKGSPSFDFAFWARGTLAEVIYFLSEGGLVHLVGATESELREVDRWPRVTVQRTADGDRFITRTRRTHADLFQSLELRVQPTERMTSVAAQG